MRRIHFILIVAALFTAAPLHAQFSIGLHAGASRAMMNVDDFDTPRYGPAGGLSADIGFGAWAGGWAGLSLRGSYVQKGAGGELSFEGIPVTFATEADYAEVSALLIASLGDMPLRLLAGPSAAFPVKCTLSVTFAPPGGSAVSESNECDDVADVATVDFGVTGGVGVVWGEGIRCTVDILYTMGLTDAITEKGPMARSTDPGKHGAAMVVAGVLIPLAGR